MRLSRAVLAILALLIPASLFAQSVGAISGNVSDVSGGVLPNASVTLVNQGTNVERTTTSNESGFFTFQRVPIGTYKVRVAAPGFQTSEIQNTNLEGQQNIMLDVKLKVSAATESVSVSAQATEIERVDSAMGQTIHATEVQNLPLNGRTFVDLALLTPGATHSEQPTSFMTRPASGVAFRAPVSLSINGMDDSRNDWRLDGIDNNELQNGGVSFISSIDGVQEFQVLSSNYSAQYGTRGGATVLVSTKAGTNDFHGSLFEYLRNDYLDARNYFDPVKKGEYRRNQFGGALGGPVLKDKTFFFTDYQGNRLRQGSPVLSTIPTDTQRVSHIFSNPIFNPVPTINGGAPTRPSYYDTSVGAYVIPQNQISPIGQAILNLYPSGAPLPGTGGFPKGFNYSSNPIQSLNDDEFDIRLDHQLRPSDTLFARFSWENANSFQPSGLPGFGAASAFQSSTYFITHVRNVVLSDTHLFSPNVINQLAFGFNRDYTTQRSYGYGTTEAADIGISGANLGTPSTSGMTLILINGINPMGDRNTSPFQALSNIYHFLESVSIVKKNHSIIAGFDFRPMQLNGLSSQTLHGQFQFTNNFTGQPSSSGSFPATTTDPASGITGTNGNAIASVLLGYPDSGQRSNLIGGQIVGRRWKEYRGYVQDNWRVTTDLTLNLGFAYAYWTPTSQSKGQLSNFDIRTGIWYSEGPGAANFLGPKVLQGDKYVGVMPDHSTAEPRIGFAWSPFGSAKNTVVRGGYGIFHDSRPLANSDSIQENPPYANTYTFQTNDINPARVLIPGSSVNGFPDNSQPTNPATYAGSLFAIDRNFKIGISQQYNLNLQQAVGGTIITLGYVGTHVTRETRGAINWNVAGPGPGNNLAANRPYPQYQTVSAFISDGALIYNALEAKAEKNSHGLYLLGTYTYSQGITNGYTQGVGGGVAGSPYYPLTLRANIPVSRSSSPLSPKADRGLSNLNLRNNFTASAVYELPFGKGRRFMKSSSAIVDGVLGGWQTNAIFTWHTGFPLGVSQLTNTSGAGVTNRPDLIPDCDLNAGAKTVNKWFNTACFQAPVVQQMGNAPIVVGYGPGRTNIDLGFYKDFHLHEQQALQFRSQFFNFFNHSQFALPTTTFGSPSFGAISSTAVLNRKIQFALTYQF